MPHGQSLEFSGVTKRFGAVTAVSGLTARVEPGQVTGFLGPNGAGKTTTLRILLGLVRATDGHATIGGKRYAELDRPLQTVGAVLEASSFHPGRTAAAHLTIYAQAAGIAKTRVGEVLDLVGLTDAAGRKVGGFSLGMRQRLGLAYALLGDPGVLVLDEPANGLDPEGIRWMRGFLRRLAAEGRTVLVSSHLLAEVQQTVDALLIISRGRLVFQGSIDELTDPDEHATVVDAPDRAALAAALRAAGVPFEVLRSGLTVRGLDPAAVGAAAAAGGVALSSLHRRGPALEEVFLDLVNGARVHASATGGVGSLSQVPGTDAAPAAAATSGVAAAAASAEAAGAALAEPAAAADSPEEEGSEADQAEESALSAAALDAEATGAPGAAAALAAAAGAAWAGDSREAESVESAHDAVAGEDLPATAEPTASAPSLYAVAGTGVIDIVPAAGQEPAEPEPIDRLQDDAEREPAVTAVESDGYAAAQPAAEAPSETGETEYAGDDPWAPEDADPDVGALGEIDDELSTPEPADADDDRPWEHYVKTDSDFEADAFFAAFDADGNPRAVPGGEADAAPTGSAAADPESETAEDGEPGADSDTTDPEPTEPGPTDLGANAGADPETLGGTAAEDERAPAEDADPEPDPEPWIPPEAGALEDAHDEAASAAESPEAAHDEAAPATEASSPTEAARDDAAEPVAATQDAASAPSSEGDEEHVAAEDRESVDQEGGDR
ncbi:ATP-binding cassette domain-containing protein [Microbacterium sp. QXD-8]|uniref:ATP-binding cassette domain-containing protein n=1 Tax=Microbacterium psychrotolerans TaxID=3068321 RepID=A0ABU0Z419_9MICO|nr:ATP-binding cassette domain-containing protein [Microbacterium sp. QXD-8]MDQ7879334.1 ATP-binding cassette domain-containing protein [Microbacterium sp. QXD-8]